MNSDSIPSVGGPNGIILETNEEYVFCSHFQLVECCEKCHMIYLILCCHRLREHDTLKNLYRLIYSHLPRVTYEKLIYIRFKQDEWLRNNLNEELPDQLLYYPDYPEKDKYWVRRDIGDMMLPNLADIPLGKKCIIFDDSSEYSYTWLSLTKLLKSV